MQKKLAKITLWTTEFAEKGKFEASSRGIFIKVNCFDIKEQHPKKIIKRLLQTIFIDTKKFEWDIKW